MRCFFITSIVRYAAKVANNLHFEADSLEFCLIFDVFAFIVIENTLSLPPISGAARLNRESGGNPGQFPLL